MCVQCEYCGAIKENLTNTCRNCGGAARWYANINNNENKPLYLPHKKKLYVIVLALIVCLASAFSYYSKGKDEISLDISELTTSVGKPPELWSWFKDLNKSKNACLIQSNHILQSLKTKNLIETKYGIYGTIKNNRVVVKCIAMSSISSKLLVAVAGNNKHSVEGVRNIIIKEIN